MYASARARRGAILGALGRRILRLEVHDDADAMLADRAIRLHRRAMRAQQLMRRDRRLEPIAMAGRERAVQIAAVGHHPRLVQRRPHRHAIVELAEHT